EILAVGDEAFQRKCKARMEQFRNAGKTIVFVSHSLDDVKKICDRACVLDFGSVIFLGKTDEAVDRYHRLLGATSFNKIWRCRRIRSVGAAATARKSHMVL